MANETQGDESPLDEVPPSAAGPTRRRFLLGAAALGSGALLGGAEAAVAAARAALVVPRLRALQEALPTRPIPSTGERIPVVGFGSTKSVLESPVEGTDPIANVIRILLSRGGTVVDTSPRSAEVDREFGRVLDQPDIRNRIFLAAKVYTRGRDAGIAQMNQNRELLGKPQIDLLQVESLLDLETHWPTVRAWKESGDARYVGVTVFLNTDHERLEAFMRQEAFDFVHLNYSILEPQAEARLLPLARDRGMAVLVNRPFMNGEYFGRVEGRAVPEWCRDFGCTAWSQFSLKYILANPAISCVLTETTNPAHMEENILGGIGRLPTDAELQRMRDLIRTF